MRKFIFPTLLLLVATQAQAQTKRIAHRSHSGANNTFSLAGADNFGNPPIEWQNRHVPATDTAKAGVNGVKTEDEKKPAQPVRNKKLKKNTKKKVHKNPYVNQ